jgi:hypothetical protein
VSRASSHQRRGSTVAPSVSPFEDDQIKAAIRALQSSTAAIDKQCEVLQAQKEAIMALRASNKPKPSIERSQANRERQQVEEKHKLDLRVSRIDMRNYPALIQYRFKT